MVSAVRGVTRETYQSLGNAFIRANNEVGFVVAREFVVVKGEQFPATPQQWNAWQNYFREKRIKNGLTDEKGYYMVPAEWPHLFDADWSMADDITQPLAIPGRKVFMHELTADERARVVQRALSNFPREPRKPKAPESHLAEPKAAPEPLGEFPEHLMETGWIKAA